VGGAHCSLRTSDSRPLDDWSTPASTEARGLPDFGWTDSWEEVAAGFAKTVPPSAGKSRIGSARMTGGAGRYGGASAKAATWIAPAATNAFRTRR
jgi:hypothetical protein